MVSLNFFDTEFIDTGKEVHLLSIGIINDKNETYYAEADWTDRSLACEWVNKNVIPHMKGPVISREQMQKEIKEFCGFRPEFWCYFGSYDWLCMCQIFGKMMDIPTHTLGWPMYFNDIQMLRRFVTHKGLPKHNGQLHNALDDAIWTKDSYYQLMSQLGTP